MFNDVKLKSQEVPEDSVFCLCRDAAIMVLLCLYTRVSLINWVLTSLWLPQRLSGEGSAAAGGAAPALGWGRTPGSGDGSPRQNACWEIPQTEEPSRLQSTGAQRMRYNRATQLQQY